MHFFAEPSLGPDAKAIPHQYHPDQQFRIDRRASRLAIEFGMIFLRELIKQSRLRFLLRSEHQPTLLLVRGIECATHRSIKDEFFNRIGSISKSRALSRTSAYALVQAAPLIVPVV